MILPPARPVRTASLRGLLLPLFLLFSAVSAMGELHVPYEAPPQAFSLSVTARCDEPVQIRLQSGAINETPKFRLRTQPRLGTLTEPKAVGGEAAVVTYSPNPGVGAGEDQFTYSVQTRKGVSVPAEVKIRLVERPPLLVANEELDFGRVLLGEKARRSLEIANLGGGVIEGRMMTKGDFVVEGDPSYRLKAGEKKQVQVDFVPTALGKTNNAIVYSGNPDRETTLVGEGTGPIRVVPANLTVWADPRGEVRKGSLIVSNQTAQTQTVQVFADSRLKLARELVLQPGAQAALDFEVDPVFPEAIDSTLELRVPGFTEKAHLRIAALGPMLRVNPQAVQFGKVPLNHPATQTVLLENVGGMGDTVRAKIEGPFQWERQSEGIWIEPGGKEEVKLQLQSTGQGVQKGTIVFTTSQGTIQVPVEASVVETTAAGEPIPQGGAPSEAIPTESQPKHAMAVYTIQVKKAEPNDCELEWGAIPGVQYHLELAKIFVDPSGKPQIAWESLENHVQLTEGEGRVLAKVSGLIPGTFYTFRAEGRDSSGAVAERTEQVTVGIPSRTWITPLRILGLALLVLAVLVAKQRWKRL